MSLLSRQLNTFCMENPSDGICKNLDSVISYLSIPFTLLGLVGVIWVLFFAKAKDISKGTSKIGIVERIALASIPTFIAMLGWQSHINLNENSDSIFYSFVLVIPFLIKNWKNWGKWLNEIYPDK